MKIDCIITAVNTNELYIDFIPMFIKCWNKLIPFADIKIILITDEIPERLKPYSHYIIIFKPIIGVSTAFTSQYIRMLYPCIMNYTGGVILADIDCFPLSSSYFIDTIKDIPDDKFIYYRDVLMEEYKQIAICYNIAAPVTWSDIFDIHTIEDIVNNIKTVNSKIAYGNTHGGSGWTSDQEDLYNRVMEWNKKTGRFEFLRDKDTKFKRLDRHTFTLSDQLLTQIRHGVFTDYHALRPYNMYKNINDAITNILPDNMIDLIPKINYINPIFLQHLPDRFNIRHIIEVGARDCNDSILLSIYFPFAKVHTFECNPKMLETCRNNINQFTSRNIVLHEHGLGEKEENIPFYIFKDENPGASSFYKRFDGGATQEVVNNIQVRRLDNIVAENNIPHVDLLCMDVQGFELNVLKGCGNFISKIKYVILEAPSKDAHSLIPEKSHSKYINAPKLEDIIYFMRENGFEIIEVVFENLIENNIMFVNTKFTYT